MRIESFSDITTTIITPTSQVPNQPCLVNPCLNGAFCVTVNGGGFRCVCPTGYTGSLCDYPGSLLVSSRSDQIYRSFHFQGRPATTGCGLGNPCLNAGVCTSTALGYQCQCQNNFGGSNCQINTGIRHRVRS